MNGLRSNLAQMYTNMKQYVAYHRQDHKVKWKCLGWGYVTEKVLFCYVIRQDTIGNNQPTVDTVCQVELYSCIFFYSRHIFIRDISIYYLL